jgi:hypothetical protein
MGSVRDIHSRNKNEGAKKTYVTPVKRHLSCPVFDSKKSKPIARFQGIAG